MLSLSPEGEYNGRKFYSENFSYSLSLHRLFHKFLRLLNRPLIGYPQFKKVLRSSRKFLHTVCAEKKWGEFLVMFCQQQYGFRGVIVVKTQCKITLEFLPGPHFRKMQQNIIFLKTAGGLASGRSPYFLLCSIS